MLLFSRSLEVSFTQLSSVFILRILRFILQQWNTLILLWRTFFSCSFFVCETFENWESSFLPLFILKDEKHENRSQWFEFLIHERIFSVIFCFLFCMFYMFARHIGFPYHQHFVKWKWKRLENLIPLHLNVCRNSKRRKSRPTCGKWRILSKYYKTIFQRKQMFYCFITPFAYVNNDVNPFRMWKCSGVQFFCS